MKREGIPASFTTASRVAILANELATININVAAVQDRGHVVVFEPAPWELHRRTAEWFWDQEVFDFIADHLHLSRSLSMRDYYLSWELKQAGIGWRNWLLARWGLSAKQVLALTIKADPSLKTNHEKAGQFIRQGGGCRATYYNQLKRLSSKGRVPRLLLAQRPPQRIPDPGLLDILRRRQAAAALHPGQAGDPEEPRRATGAGEPRTLRSLRRRDFLLRLGCHDFGVPHAENNVDGTAAIVRPGHIGARVLLKAQRFHDCETV